MTKHTSISDAPPSELGTKQHIFMRIAPAVIHAVSQNPSTSSGLLHGQPREMDIVQKMMTVLVNALSAQFNELS